MDTIIISIIFIMSHWCVSDTANQLSTKRADRAPIYRNDNIIIVINILSYILLFVTGIYLLFTEWILLIVLFLIGFLTYFIVGRIITRILIISPIILLLSRIHQYKEDRLSNYTGNNPEKLYNSAMYYLNMGDYLKAEIIFNNILDINDKNSNAYYQLGIIYLEKRLDDEVAMEYFKKSIENNESHIDSYYELGIIYRERGEYDRATKCFEKVKYLDPNNETVYYDLGVCHIESDNKEKAKECHHKLLCINSLYADDLASYYTNKYSSNIKE